MKIFYSIFFILILAINIQAKNFEASGYDVLGKYSKQKAISLLLDKLDVALKKDPTLYRSIIKAKDRKYFEYISSDLPLLGVEFKTFKDKGEIRTRAILDGESLSIYKIKIGRLQQEVFDYYELFQISKNKTNKYNILIKLYKDIQELYRLKIVAAILGDIKTADTRVSIESILTKLKRVQKKTSSIDTAAFDLTKGIFKNKIYISPVKLKGSKEVTPFAKVLKESMAKQLKSVTYSSEGDYYLKGYYEIMPRNIFVSVNLYDSNNMIISSNTAFLNPKAYEGLDLSLKIKEFDMSLQSNIINNGSLTVSLDLDGYDRADGMAIRVGDFFDMGVKSDRAVCYFMVRHQVKDDIKLSYLLPLSEEENPYIGKIDKKSINKISYPVQNILINKPLGNETYQIFASEFDFRGRCQLFIPKCTIEGEDDRCVIKGDPKKIISKIRTEIFQKGNRTIEKAEASVSFTTF